MAAAPQYEGVVGDPAWVRFYADGAYAQPQAAFPGDEVISPDEYAACMQNNWYVQAGAWFVAAAGEFGLDVKPHQNERHKRTLGAARLLDEWLDEPDDQSDRFATYDEVVRVSMSDDRGEIADMIDNSFADTPRLSTAMTLFTNALHPLPSLTKLELQGLGHDIGQSARSKVSTESPVSYAMHAFREGRQTGLLFASALTADMPETRAVTDYNSWMGACIGAMTLRDSREDLVSDYESGVIQLRPTVAASAALASAEAVVMPFVLRRAAGRRAAQVSKTVKQRLGLDSLRPE
jgi:hypothetical protein